MTKLPAQDANGDPLVLYFAYGSMVNPVSKKRRNIIPSASWPAKVKGWALRFNAGGMGMGNIEADPDAEMHGVIHQVTQKEWEVLCRLEPYNVVDLEATPYDPDQGYAELPKMVAKAFVMPPEDQKQGVLPQERYIDIISRGLQHYGVHPDWVAHVAATPHVPRRTGDQMHRLPVEPGALQQMPVWRPEQFEPYRFKVADDGYVYFAINRTVCRAKMPTPEEAAQHGNQAKLMVKFYSGRDIVPGLVMGLYEPILPEVESVADLTDAHVAWAEDMVMHYMKEAGMQVEVIGRLEQPLPWETLIG